MKTCDVCRFNDRDKLDGGVNTITLSAKDNTDHPVSWYLETELCDECLTLVVDTLQATLKQKLGIPVEQ